MTMQPQPRQPNDELPQRVALMVVTDCPNSTTAAATLSDALTAAGHPELGFATIVVDTFEQAESHGFIGSPSIHIDGHDVLPVSGAHAAVACRTYAHPDGTRHGVPETIALTEALRSALRPRSSPR